MGSYVREKGVEGKNISVFFPLNFDLQILDLPSFLSFSSLISSTHFLHFLIFFFKKLPSGGNPTKEN